MATKKDIEAALVQLVKAVEAQSSRVPQSENVRQAIAVAKSLVPDASWTD